MKSILILLSIFFLTVHSQSITVLSPSSGSEITPGQNVTVQLAFGNSLTGVEHVSAVIAMINCAGAPCPTDASDSLGIPLFAGNYTPQYHEQNLASSISGLIFFPPYENFVRTNDLISLFALSLKLYDETVVHQTVTVPGTLAAGTNMLTVAHFMLVGASAVPVLQFDNVTVSTPPSASSTRRGTLIRGRRVYV
ncbi:hypothetical protein GGU10DRAFT_398138 [Lentinula aff. detonsa]|uniref:Cohesin domain-containing protein n=1 Tax=Lentinula aff. detonsa TaxID=2804958 RepID=A0AA38NU91_9AGAR|nr:hypothetical protein GGU10DRAFT_398138 [Lentinula aff. detonsa]